MDEMSPSPSPQEAISRASCLSPEFQTKMEQQDPANRRVLAFTDIDGTWMNTSDTGPNPASTDVLNTLRKDNIPLIAVTGRSIELVDNDPRLSSDFPFDAVFTAVGTELWITKINPDGSRTFALDPEWDFFVRDEQGFKRELVYPECVKIRDMLNKGNPGYKLEFQPRDIPSNVDQWNAFKTDIGAPKPAGDEPQPYKISYTFSGSLADAATLKARFLAELSQAGYGKVQVVMSQEKKSGQGDILKFNLDIVPITKADAVQHLAKRAQEELHLPETPLTMYAGDSGNDIEPMSVADVGIIVGGAKQSDFDSWISGLEVLRKSPSGEFFYVRDPQTHSTRLIFREMPGSPIMGPDSLKKARRILEKLSALQTP